MNRIVANVISYFLGEYVEDIDRNKINVSLWNKNAVLQDIQIKKNALIRHQIPFEVTRGIVGMLDLQIEKLVKSLPMNMVLSDIFILGRVRSDVSIASESLEANTDKSELQKLCAQTGVSPEEVISSSIAAILEQFRAQIKNIHIRIEFDQGDHIVAAGITIPLIEVLTSDKTTTDILYKRLIIHDLSIYMDPNAKPLEILDDTKPKADIIRQFKEVMLNSMQGHQCLLKNFTFEGTLEHALNPTISVQNQITINTQKINIILNELQYHGMLRFAKQFSDFQRLLYFSPLGRPTKMLDYDSATPPVSRQWWDYTYQCAKKKIHPFSFKIKRALLFLKDRKKVCAPLSEYIRATTKEAHQKTIKKYEKQYSPELVISFMNYAQRQIIITSKPESIGISQQDIMKIVESKRQQFNAQSLTFNSSIDDFTFDLLTKEEKMLSSINLLGMTAAVNITGQQITSMFKMKKMTIDTDSNTKIFKLKPSNQEQCISGNLVLDNAAKKLIINGVVTSPIIYADIPYFLRLGKFFDNSSLRALTSMPSDFDPKKILKQVRREITELEIAKFIDEKKYLKVNLHMDTPTLIIPAEEQIQIDTGSIDIVSGPCYKPERKNIKSFYDKFLISLKNFTVKMGEEAIVTPAEMSVDFDNIFVPMKTIVNQDFKINMKTIMVKLKKRQYNNILKLVDSISELMKDEDVSIDVQLPKKKPNKPQGFSKDIFIKMDAEFEAFALQLMNDNGAIENSFSINNLSCGMEIKDGIMNTDVILKSLLCNQGLDNTFCSFGAKEENAVTTKVCIHDNVTDLNVDVCRPFVLFDLSWFNSLTKFFADQEPSIEKIKEKVIEYAENSKEKEQIEVVKTVSDQIMKMKINVVSPNIQLHLPQTDNKTFNIEFGIEKLLSQIDIEGENQSINVGVEEFYTAFNDRKLIKDITGGVYITINDKTTVKGNLPSCKVELVKDDFNNIMEIVTFITSYMELFDLGNNTNENQNQQSSDLSVDLGVPNIELCFVENGTKMFSIYTNIFSFKMENENIYCGIDSISLASKDKVIGTINNFKFEDNTIKLIDDTKIILTEEGLGWLIPIFLKDPVHFLKSPEVKEKPKQKQENVVENPTNIKLEVGKLFVTGFYKEERVFDLAVPSVSGSIISGNDLKVNMVVNSVNITNAEIGDIIIIKDKFTFNMHQNILDFNLNKAFVAFQYNFFLTKFLGSILGLLGGNKEEPAVFSQFRYNAKVNEVELKMIGKDNFAENNCKFDLKAIKVDTAENCTDMTINVGDMTSSIISMSNIKVLFKMLTSDQPPKVSKWFPASLKHKYSKDNTKFIVGYDIGLNIPNVDYRFDQLSTKTICSIITSFLPTEIIHEIWEMKLLVNVNMANTSISVADQKIAINNFKFIMAEKQKMSVEKVIFNDLIVNQFELQMSPILLALAVESVTGILDVDSLLFVVNQFLTSAFTSTKFSIEDPEDPPQVDADVALNVASTNILLRIIKDQNRMLYLNTKMTFNQTKSGLSVLAKNLCVGFQDYQNDRSRVSIINDCFAGIQLSDDQLSASFSNLDVKLSVDQLAAIYILIDKFSKMIPASNNDSDMQSKANVDEEIKKLPFKIKIFIPEFSIQLNYQSMPLPNNDIPFVIFQLGQVDVHLDPTLLRETDLAVQVKRFDFFNMKSQLWDILVAPFDIKLKVKYDENVMVHVLLDQLLDLHVDKYLVKSITQFANDIVQRFENQDISSTHEQGILVKNNTSYKIVASVENGFTYNIEPLSELTLQEAAIKTNIIYKIDAEKEVQGVVNLQNLVYSRMILKDVLCYNQSTSKRKEMVFSSLLVFENKSIYSIKINAERREIAAILPGEHIPLMHSVPLNSAFYIGESSFHLSDLRKKPIVLSVGKGVTKTSLIVRHHMDSVNKVTFLNNGKFINHTPFVADVIVDNHKVGQVKPDETIPLNLINTKADVLIHLETSLVLTNGQPVKVKIDTEKTYLVPSKYNNVHIKVTHNKYGQSVLNLFIPVILRNLSDTTFFVTTSDLDQATCQTGTDLYLSDKSVVESDTPSILFTPHLILDKTKVQPIEATYTVAPSHYFLAVAEHVYIPLIYSVSYYNEFTRLAIFRPKYNIINDLNFEFSLKPRQDGTYHNIPRSDRCVLPECDETNEFLFKSNQTPEILLNFENPINCTFMTKNGPVQMIVSIKDGMNFIHFRYPEGKQQVTIRNMTNKTIKMTQFNIFDQTVEPFSKNYFAYTQPFKDQHIKLFIDNREIEIEIEDAQPITVNNTIIQVQRQMKDITIYISYSEIKPKRFPAFALAFKMSCLQVGIISNYREEFLLSVKDTAFVITSTPFSLAASLKVGNLILDDLHPLAVFETMVESNQFLDFGILVAYENNSQIIKDISIRVSPINLYLDNSALCDLVSLIMNDFVLTSAEEDEESEAKKHSTKSSAVNETVNIRSVEYFTCTAINVNLQHESSTRRPMMFKCPFPEMSIIPSITDAHISLDKIEIKDLILTTDSIMASVVNPLKNQAFRLGLKLLLGIDLFLNVGAISDSFVKTVTRGNPAFLIGGTLRIGENAINTVGTILRTFTGESAIKGTRTQKVGLNASAGQTFVNGMESLGSGIVDGIAGIFVDPIRGAKKGGAGGFFKGIATGITGVVARPVLGVADAGAGIIGAARKAISDDTVILRRQRLPRAILSRTITPINEEFSRLQNIAQMDSPGNETYNEQAQFIFACFFRKECVCVLTNSHIFFIRENKVVKCYDFEDINQIQFKQNTVIIQGAHNFEFVIADNEMNFNSIKQFLITKVHTF